MPETYRTLTSRDVGTTRTRVGSYTAPSGAQTIVIGLTVANKLTSTVKATIEHSDGTNFTFITDEIDLATGQTLAPLAELGKIVLPTGHGIFVTSNTATSLDVVMSLVEIT